MIKSFKSEGSEMDEKKLEDLRKEFDDLYKDFINLEKMARKYTDNPDENLSNIMDTYNRFLKYYEKYLTLLNQAKTLGIVEENFEEEYIKVGGWEKNYYFKEIQAEITKFNLEREPEITQIKKNLESAKALKEDKFNNYMLAGLFLTGFTLVGGIIPLVIYKIDMYFLNKKIQELEEKKSQVEGKYRTDTKTLFERYEKEHPLKQDIYHHTKSINTLFKPFKEQVEKTKLPKGETNFPGQPENEVSPDGEDKKTSPKT